MWCETPKGKRMPVDVDRSPAGNVRVTYPKFYDDPLAETLTRVGMEMARAEFEQAREAGLTDEPELMLHTCHWATCPNADKARADRERRKAAA
jgi:hypothetical protein